MGRTAKIIPFPADPLESAKTAGLRYVRDNGPGIIRVKAGKEFAYLAPNGKPVRDKNELARIRSLAIPPAWTEVWICPSPNGHIQAVGRDAKRRKQYRYHPLYRRVRDETKFGRMLAFGQALPKIRKRVTADLKLAGMPKQKVLATVVSILDCTGMRVGNDEYVRQNSSFGLTTLRDKHVQISGSTLRFRFQGKSGQAQDIALTDARLAKIVAKSRDIPGYELFQYIDDNGDPCPIDSSDVNNYLREITGQDFTAKDFRTWHGTGHAAIALREMGDFQNASEAKKNMLAAVKRVAEKLGNRPATCRKYYIHPVVFEAYSSRSLFEALESCRSRRPEEECIMRLVPQYLKRLKPLREPSDLSAILRASLKNPA